MMLIIQCFGFFDVLHMRPHSLFIVQSLIHELHLVSLWDILLELKVTNYMILSNQRFFISRDVLFFEHLFPFHDIHDPTALTKSDEFLGSFVLPCSSIDISKSSSLDVRSSGDDGLFPTNPIDEENIDQYPSIDVIHEGTLPSTTDSAAAHYNDPAPHANAQPTHAVDEPRRSTRRHCPPSYLKEYHCNLLSNTPNTSTHPYFFGRQLSYVEFSPPHKHFMLNVGIEYEPSYYHQAVKFAHWQNAMDVEIQAMERTHTTKKKKKKDSLDAISLDA